MLTVDDYLSLPPVSATYRFAYGTDPEQFGDLYLPAGTGPWPLLILIHGGCWRAQYGLAQLGQFCAAFAQEDVAVWNLEYRRLGNGGGWPATFEDIAAGIDYIVTIAQEHMLDLSRVVAVGHSAGGHLALWAAARHRLSQDGLLYAATPLTIHSVVSLAGIPDLSEAVAQNICRGAAQELLGGLIHELPERYVVASPSSLLPLGVPQVLIAGERDTTVPIDYVRPYVLHAAQLGDSIAFIPIADAGHFEIVVPQTPAWSVVRRAILNSLLIQPNGKHGF